MIFLKDLYMIANIIMLFAVGSVIFSAFRTKTKVSIMLLRLHIVTSLAIACCFSFYLIKNALAANIVWGIYLLLLDIVLYFSLHFVSFLENENINTKISKILRSVYVFFVIIDAVLIVVNIKTHFIYDIISVNIDDSFTTWSVDFKKGFYFHLLFCYLIAFTTFLVLIKNIIKASRINKPAYIYLFVVFVIIMFMNAIFVMISEQWIFDYSSIVYGCLLMIVYFHTVYSVPKYIQKNLILISSDGVSDGIICFDDTGRCVYINKVASLFYDDSEEQREKFTDYINSQSDMLIRTEKIMINNEEHTFKVEFRRLKDKKNRNSGCYLKFNDCTNEVLSLERETYRATHDELTGLYSRDYFFREMARILKAEPDLPRYLVCTDIKDFKLVNELFGSEFGDRLLIRQSEMLKKADFPGVIHGRISGDRYAMLIPKEKFNPDLAKVNSQKIIELEKEIDFKLTVYIGVYEITDPTENVHSMYDKANLAIKSIDPSTNKRIVYYDTNLMNKLMVEKTVVNEFENALKTNQFQMFLQPQISVKTRKCIGGEALIRWNHPEYGWIEPESFVKALEKSDQIYKLDFFIWEQAAQKLAEWKKKGIDFNISVNISVKDFYYSDLYEYFTNLVEKYNIAPDKLNLEITESVVINDNKVHRKILKCLQDYGFKIEMDDFGSGYSSLNVLKDIEMNVLKIDMGFLHHSKNEDRANLIVSSIVKMAKELNMEVVSEGVETEQQAEILAGFGVDIFQGFLYSKPLSIQEFEQLYMEVN